MPKKKYRIHATGRTGDSFGRRDTTWDVNLEWDDLDTAKENLRRIREHYEYYRFIDCSHRRWDLSKDEEESKLAEYMAARWYVPKHEWSLKLVADDGQELQYSAPWCGYFEALYGAEIQRTDPDAGGMRFEVE